MNKKTRQHLAKLNERLVGIIGDVDDLAELIDEVAQEEQEKYDNLSDGLQESERGQEIQQAAENLGEAVNSLKDAVVGLLHDASAALERTA